MRNREQIALWNGPRGRAWIAEQEQRDRSLAPFGDAALDLARPSKGERLVDVGCGCGATTLALADAVGPTGSVLGIDVSAPMLGRARERAASVPQASFVEADGATFAFAADASLVFSRFGVMFFDDPRAAFANLRTALRPDGRLVFVCWRRLEENGWLAIPFAAVRKALPSLPPPPSGGPGPLSFADPDRVRAFLEGAGFADVTFRPVDHPMSFGEGSGVDAAAAEAITSGPTARLLDEAGEDLRAQAIAAVRTAFAAHVSGETVLLPGAAWLVHAIARTAA